MLNQSLCLFLYQYHAVLMTMALQYSLIVGSMIPPNFYFFLKIALLLLFGAFCGSIWIFEIFVLVLWNMSLVSRPDSKEMKSDI